MRRFTALLLILPAWPISGTAGDLVDAYEAALQYDPRFKAARYRYEAAREKIPQAKAELLPSMSFDAKRSKTEQDIKERENPVFGIGTSTFYTSTWQLQASQPIFRLSSWIQLGQSKAVVRQAYADFVAAEQELVLRVSALYLNLLASRDAVSLAEAELAAVGRQLELVEAQRRGGLANVTAEYEAQARYSLVEADLIEARYALDDAYQALREAVGDAITSVIPLKEEIPLVKPGPANVANWIERALEQNYSLIARQEAVSVAELEVKRLRAAHYPTLELVASHGNTDLGGAVTGGASDTDTTEVGIQVRMPIYTGGAISSQTREAQMNYRRALEERTLQHRVVMRETRAAYQGVISAISRVEALGNSVLSQTSALEGMTTGYRAGVYTFLDVLDAQRDLYSTKRDYYRARYEYLLNTLQLKQKAGSLSEEDLVLVNGLLDHAAGNVSPMDVGGESAVDMPVPRAAGAGSGASP